MTAASCGRGESRLPLEQAAQQKCSLEQDLEPTVQKVVVQSTASLRGSAQRDRCTEHDAKDTTILFSEDGDSVHFGNLTFQLTPYALAQLAAMAKVTAVSPYVAEPVFDTLDVMGAVNDLLTDETVTRVDLLGGYTAIVQDSAGVLLVEFEAYDTTPSSQTVFSDGKTSPSKVYSGIAFYDAAATTSGPLRVEILATNYWAAGASSLKMMDAYPAYARGQRLQGLAVAPATSGGLQMDDVVVLRASDDATRPEGVPTCAGLGSAKTVARSGCVWIASRLSGFCPDSRGAIRTASPACNRGQRRIVRLSGLVLLLKEQRARTRALVSASGNAPENRDIRTPRPLRPGAVR